MDCALDDVNVHYVEHGRGVPLVALHGAGVDHREIEGALEAIVPADGYRRIYPDLPGMGRSTVGGLTSNEDVVALLARFIDRVAPEPVLLVGHSYGAYLARGVTARRPDIVRGLALLCPLAEQTGAVPAHRARVEEPDAYDDLDPAHRAGFDEYFVVRTRHTARLYHERVAPGMALVDEDALGRIFGRWPLDLTSDPFSPPSLIVAGLHDSVVGFAGAVSLLDQYPGATLAVIDAGHALVHERPDLLGALFGDWLDRATPRPRT